LVLYNSTIKIRKMKNFFKINLALLFVSFITLTSCSIDDDDAVVASTTENTISASLNRSGEVYVFPSDSGEISVGIELSMASTTLSSASYTVNGVEHTVQISQGETVANIVVPNVLGSSTTIQLTDVKGLYNENLILGSNTEVTLISVPAASSNSISVVQVLNDPDGSFYFTFGAFDEDGGWLGDAYGGANPSFSIPLTSALFNSVDFAPNYFAIDIYSFALTDPGYTIYIVFPDSTVEVFSGNDFF